MKNSSLNLNTLDQFSSKNVNSNNQGIFGTAIANTVTNIDLKITDDCFITGGILRTNISTFGDKATFQVVDIDNILGYGINTVLGQYITNWYMKSDNQEQMDEISTYPAKILAGLYLRVIYTSIGQSNVDIIINYRLHKVLY